MQAYSDKQNILHIHDYTDMDIDRMYRYNIYAMSIFTFMSLASLALILFATDFTDAHWKLIVLPGELAHIGVLVTVVQWIIDQFNTMNLHKQDLRLLDSIFTTPEWQTKIAENIKHKHGAHRTLTGSTRKEARKLIQQVVDDELPTQVAQTNQAVQTIVQDK